MPVVIDASMTMAWCFEDEATPGSDAVLQRLGGDIGVVPSLWPLEVANVLLVAERRGRLTEAQTARFMELLSQLPIEVDADAADIDGVVEVGRRHDLSAYDSAYLLLAERRGIDLATRDRRLASAARVAGVVVTGDG